MLIKKNIIKHNLIRLVQGTYTVVVNSNEEFLYVLNYIRKYSGTDEDILHPSHENGYKECSKNSTYYIGRYHDDPYTEPYYNSTPFEGRLLSFGDFKYLK